jgi:methyl-accepting chemotaxis protein
LKTTPATGLAPEVAEVRRLRDRYGDAFQATVEQIELDGPMSALEHFATVTEPALKELLAATDMLAVHLQDTMQAEVEGLTDESTTARQRIVLIGLFALLAGALLAVWVARHIVRPVNAAAAFADQIAAGNYRSAAPPARRTMKWAACCGRSMSCASRMAEREARIAASPTWTS